MGAAVGGDSGTAFEEQAAMAAPDTTREMAAAALRSRAIIAVAAPGRGSRREYEPPKL